MPWPAWPSRRSNTGRPLVLACCKDDAGQPIFKPDDVEALGKKQAAILERIVNVCQRLSGFTQADIDATVGN